MQHLTRYQEVNVEGEPVELPLRIEMSIIYKVSMTTNLTDSTYVISGKLDSLAPKKKKKKSLILQFVAFRAGILIKDNTT